MPEKEPVCLVLSLLAAGEKPRKKALELLSKEYGPLAWLSRPLPFDYTSYYESEMGPGLTRRLAVFEELALPWQLADVKRTCLGVEKSLSEFGKRCVNLDPGFLSAGSFTLASAKSVAHRVCLTRGIYAEVTLLYQWGEYRPLAWTYPDYGSQLFRDMLKLRRERYLWRLKETKRRKGDQPCPGP